MNRYKLLIEYDGTDFAGWQRQENAISIQQILEESIFKFSSEKTELYGSGRTDAGVHALEQVAHFDLLKEYDPEEIIGAINYHSKPNPIVILNCEKVSADFHSRFSAIERSYLYRIVNRKSPLALDHNRAWHINKDLNFELMREASRYFIGTHDFTSFRAAECQAKSPIKTINNILLSKIGDEIRLEIYAKSFLHHMVRNIVGTLVHVGLGKFSPGDIKVILDKKDRSSAGPTAPSCGLYFKSVRY